MSNQISKIEKELFEENVEIKKRIKKIREILNNYPFLISEETTLKILTNEEVFNTISKYEEEVAKSIAYWLAEAAYRLKDKECVIEMSRILRSDEVFNTISKYEEKIAKSIAHLLGWAAYELKDREAIIEISRTIRKYEEKIAVEIAYRLRWAAYELKDKEAVIEISRTIRKYEGEVAEKIADWLGGAAYELKDKDKVFRIIKILNNVGKSVIEIINYEELKEILEENLDYLIKNEKSFDAVVSYIKSNKKLPKPDENNIENYEEIINDYVKNNFGISKNLSINQILMLFSIPEEFLEDVVELVNNSKEINEKIYNIESENNIEDYFKNYNREEIVKYAITSIVGSKDKNKEKEAINIISKIVGEKTIYKARNEFHSKYKNLSREIIKAYKENNINKAVEILKSTNNEFILDVLNVIDYRDVNIENAKILKAVESKNPLDYDSRVLLACTYFPVEKDEDGIIEYCKDDKFILVRYDIGNKTLGTAICYLENDIFLVDAVEGNRVLRKDKIFEIIYRDLIERAKERNCKMIIFNKNVLNETPRKFLEYLKSKNLEEGEIEMELNTEGYLEASENKVRGYIVIVKLS